MVGELCLNLIISVWINVSTSQEPPHKGYEKKGGSMDSPVSYITREEREIEVVALAKSPPRHS